MNHLNPKLFPAFKAVAEVKSFNEAAEMASMTQANISKHIKSLEEQIGGDLFLRTPKGPVITEIGKRLLDHIKRIEDLYSEFSVNISQNEQKIEGLVSYSMPTSCLLSPHFPMLLDRRLEYPKLEIQLSMMPSNQVFAEVLDGNIDFGFVTKLIEHPNLNFLPFCKEEYVLVGAPSMEIENLTAENLLEYKYIEYPEMSVYFEFLQKYFFPELKNINSKSLYYAGKINSIQGAILMVIGGLGITSIPRHCVQHHIDAGELIAWESPKPEAKICDNQIYIIELSNKERSLKAGTVISWFFDMIGDKH